MGKFCALCAAEVSDPAPLPPDTLCPIAGTLCAADCAVLFGTTYSGKGCDFAEGSQYQAKVKQALSGAVFANAPKPMAVRQEAPCRSCKRPNDVGVQVYWCCGGVP